MKQNNAAVTYDEVNQIVGESPQGISGTLCASKESLINYWGPLVDVNPLVSYDNKQLVKYQDIKVGGTTPVSVDISMPMDSGTVSGSNLIIPYNINGTEYTFTILSSIGTIKGDYLEMVTSNAVSVEIPYLVNYLNEIFKSGVFTISYYVNTTDVANTAVDILTTYPYRITSEFKDNGISTFIGDYVHDLKTSFGTLWISPNGYGVFKVGNKNWVKVTYVIDQTTVKIYEENTLRYTASISGFNGCYGDAFYLANFESYSDNTVRLKNIMIFKRALSESEIANL